MSNEKAELQPCHSEHHRGCYFQIRHWQMWTVCLHGSLTIRTGIPNIAEISPMIFQLKVHRTCVNPLYLLLRSRSVKGISKFTTPCNAFQNFPLNSISTIRIRNCQVENLTRAPQRHLVVAGDPISYRLVISKPVNLLQREKTFSVTSVEGLGH